MRIPPSWNDTNGAEGKWGGFLDNGSCSLPLDRYLYALAKEANRTRAIFLSITEQRDCLSKLNTTEKDVCGIERLTSGNGGCSDYSVTDVVNELGRALQRLYENCKNLGSNNESGEECNSCLGMWEQMAGSANDSNSLTGEEAHICRFLVLVSFTSLRIEDMGWIQSVYTCLGIGIPVADQARQGKKITFVTGLGILLGGAGVILLMVSIVWLIWFKKRKGIKLPEGVDGRDDSVSEGHRSAKVSLEEVHLATDNLSASSFIGQGVAGKVYKGVLSDGRRIAVKHLINDGHMETFVREVTSLSHVKHPDLVELIGHCDGEDESFLVYELCEYGNLSEWLFGKHKFLTWIQRLEIAIDCARGLWFLHSYPEGCIVHRDIKVINMGLSYVSSEVRGTFGYVDPEYQKDRHVHPSTDVYSFGIVLLQLLSGQRVINLEVTRPMTLSKMAKNLRKGGDITEFADPKLNGEYSDEAFQLILRLALSCTGLKRQRPSMEKVVAVLEKARRMSEIEKSLDPSFRSA